MLGLELVLELERTEGKMERVREPELEPERRSVVEERNLARERIAEQAQERIVEQAQERIAARALGRIEEQVLERTVEREHKKVEERPERSSVVGHKLVEERKKAEERKKVEELGESRRVAVGRPK